MVIRVGRAVLLAVIVTLAAAVLHALVLLHFTIDAVTRVIEQDGVAEASACIRQEVLEHFGGALFDSLRQSERRDEVARQLLGLMRRHGGFRVKVYDVSGAILWSDEARLIGQRFPDNFLLDRALAGEVVSKFEKPERSEHVYERGEGAYVTEIYVPILDASGGVQGVVEMYRRADDVAAGISRVTRTVWTGAAVATAFLCVTLALIVGYGQRRVLRLNRQIREQRDELASEKAKLDAVVNGVGVGLLLVGQDRRVLWANRVLGQFAGGKRDPVGRSCHDVLWGADDPCTECASRTALSTGIEARVDKSVGGKNGQTRHYHVVAWPMRDVSGKATRTLEMVQDVTERVQIQARFQQAAKLAAVGELAGHVAHEVNNPIGVVSAKARLLLSDRRGEMSTAVADEIGKIVELADRVAGIARGLLSYCRPSPSARVPLDLRGPVRKALAMIESRARALGARIEDGFDEVAPAVLANGAEMEQVFLNLFLNALDAMPGGGRLAVAVRAGLPAGPNSHPWVIATVDDSGTGIPDAIRGRLFEPFVTTKSEAGGTGLGLAICAGIIRDHGGVIEAASAPGRGARFTIRLPVATGAGRGAGRLP